MNQPEETKSLRNEVSKRSLRNEVSLKTMKELADACEARWRREGQSEAQIEARKLYSKFIIDPARAHARGSSKKPAYTCTDSLVLHRSKLDNVMAERRMTEELKEVWDE